MSGTRKSILMLTNTGNDLNKVGDDIKGGSWYGYTDGITTVQVTYQNFTGGFGIQGTLALNPTDDDWFWIRISDAFGNCDVYPYITYPRDPLAPTGSNEGTLNGTQGDTGTDAFTFVGNFTYLRSILTRDYIQPPPTPAYGEVYYLGQIDRVLLSL